MSVVSFPTVNTPDEAAILAIERPHKSLWTYYLLACIAIPPLFPFVIIPAYFRFHTMRYRFTSEGISMRWGVLFRREIIVNYARIQDIHLRSNIVERWLGLARILIQTASGSSSAEMTLEGIPQFEAVRDYLYDRMRGVKDHGHKPAASNAPQAGGDDNTELALLLREVASELRAVRQQLEARK